VPKEPRQKNVVSQKQGDTVTRNIVIGMVALVVLSGVIFTFLDRNSSPEVTVPAAIEQISSAYNGEKVTSQTTAENDNGIVFNADVKPQIDIWEDFQCPFCNVFEKSMGSYIEGLIRNKEAKVVYHMVSFIGSDSVRAANAAYCAADEGRFIEFHKALYSIQGQENSGVYINANLVEVGKRLGMTSDTFASCVNDGKYTDTVKKVYDSMQKNKVTGTPTLFINGKLWERSGTEFVVDELKAAVEAAKK